MKKIETILLVFLLIGCKTSKVIQPNQELVEDTTICEQRALLLDRTGDENCGFLFQLDDGTKLLPSTMPEVDIPFIDGDYVYIGYKRYDEETTRTNSLCGQEDEVVEITCIRKYAISDGTAPKTHEDCQPVAKIADHTWLPEVSDKLKAQKAFEFDYEIGYLYLLNANGVSHLYDCLGNKMCSTTDNGDCSSLIETLGEGKVIQVRR